MQQGKKQKN